MKKQLILGLTLLLLVLIALGTYFFVDYYQKQKENEEAREAAALQLTSFQSTNVTKLELHTPELDYTIEPDENSNWVVTNAEDVHINTYYITALCTYGSMLTAEEDLGAVDDATLESYGLTDPVSITYYVDNMKKTVYIGNSSPTNEYFYMMQEGIDHVYLVDADTAGYLHVTPNQLRYRYIVEDTSSDICKITLKNKTNTVYCLEKNDKLWDMTAPLNRLLSVDNSKVNSLLITLNQLEIDDFGESNISKEDYASYGVDQPGYTFQFVQENGDTTTLLFEDYDPLVSSYINCLHEETGDIWKFDSSYVYFLQTKMSDYLLDTLYKPGIEEVSSMHIIYDGSYNNKTIQIDSSLTLDFDNGQYNMDGTEISDIDSEAVTAIKAFFTQAAGLSYEEIQPDAEIVEAKPTLTLEYTLKDGSTHAIELLKNDDTTYWARVDGKFTTALVRQRELSDKGKLLECYSKLKEIIDEKSNS